MLLRLDRAAEQALARLAIRERREPRAQAEHIVIAELERRGLVPSADATDAGGESVVGVGRSPRTRRDNDEVK